MPTIKMPDYGVTGLPKKESLRFDFSPSELNLAIETRGYRLVWSRACPCPCPGVNDQTQQKDPNCTLCSGTGWVYFGPQNYVVDETKVGTLTDLQKHIVTRHDGAVIKGVMSGLGTTLELFAKTGTWLSGTSSVTVRHENRLGYNDRLVGLDSEIVYAETVKVEDPTVPLVLRYPIIHVNLLRSFTRRYLDPDFELTTEGAIKWLLNAPQAGDLVSIHYTTYPVWLVVDHPKSTRDSLSKKKTKTPVTPGGNPIQLPVQATVRYDFLPMPGDV